MAITVRLHELNKEPREVTVHESDPIHVLQQEVQGNDKRFILFHRYILNTSFSFKFFKIHDGDDLYVIRSPRNENRQAQKKQILTQKQRMIHSHLKMPNGEVEVIDKTAAFECIRLLDLLSLRDQMRPSLNRQYQLTKTTEEQQHDTGEELVLESNKLKEPATESLPIFWPNRNGRLVQSSILI